MHTLNGSAIDNFVQLTVLDFVEPARFEMVLFTIGGPAHCDQRMSDERDMVTAPGAARAQTFAIDVRRNSLTCGQHSQSAMHDAAEPERCNKLVEPRRLGEPAVRATAIMELRCWQLAERA